MSMLSRFAATGGGGDPYWNNVSLLLDGAGTNGSTVFTDLSGTPKTITAYGNAQISTAVKLYGTGAMYFPNATSYIKCAESTTGVFNTNDFTVELWGYFFISVNPVFAYQCIFSTRDGTTSNENSVFFGITNTGNIVFFTSSAILTSPNAIPTSSWIHLALVRKSGTLSIYMNGVSQGSVSFTTALTGTIPTIANEYNLGTGAMNAYFYDFRITKGIARYTADFTPPTAAMPTY